ncbi:hypothetical protein [Bosea sp. BIWAKO-01]|uniref:hypothetical protein n=1 Tax=Bosea sp. BIWAKO-01 TaxID=506668 RepID=UPI000852B35F|nr:hypothetical protein [Bosea sp. BIWAKO-01]GAU85977.1 hypothetical protein BIWAKO_05925 [Bosea sp. BIWAKO-01]
MRQHVLAAAGCLIATMAAAQQDAKQAVDKWRACADATAARYAKSTESALVVARLAALACAPERKQAAQAVAMQDGESFAEQYVETVEKYYVDRLAVKVIEMRLQSPEKR